MFKIFRLESVIVLRDWKVARDVIQAFIMVDEIHKRIDYNLIESGGSYLIEYSKSFNDDNDEHGKAFRKALLDNGYTLKRSSQIGQIYASMGYTERYDVEKV